MWILPNGSIKTNIVGTDNVLTATIEEGVEAVICLSTDKVAYPINAMGKSKSLEESVAIAESRYSGKTKSAVLDITVNYDMINEQDKS